VFSYMWGVQYGRAQQCVWAGSTACMGGLNNVYGRAQQRAWVGSTACMGGLNNVYRRAQQWCSPFLTTDTAARMLMTEAAYLQ
jgi:hypothetical protein